MILRPLSIVHLTTFLQGGAGRAVVDLACAQQAAGHQVLVVSSATGEPGYETYPHHLERLRDEAIPVLLMDSLFKRDRRLNDRVLERLQTERPRGSVDVVHAHAGTPARIGLRYARVDGDRIPVVQTQHGWGTNKTPSQAVEDLAALGEVDRVVTTSEATRKLLVDIGLAPERAVAIPCGISGHADVAASEGALAAVAPFRARGFQVIGCVGSITANKNQRALVDALALLLPRKVACVLIGEGGEALAEYARRLGVGDRLLVPGYRRDADAWMRAFDLLAVPSLTEGQGLVVLEAFRAQVPVVASRIASLREMVADGETGWLSDPHDPRALATALEVALDASAVARERITRAARQTFLRRYTIDHMVACHERVYRELVGS